MKDFGDTFGAEGTPVEDDALGDIIRDAQKDCESEKEKAKFDHMLEDHKKLGWAKKIGYNIGVVKIEDTE